MVPKKSFPFDRIDTETSYVAVYIDKGELFMENKMFCFQCQETAGGKGCTQVGVCGKKPEIAALQDLLLYVTKGLGEITNKMRAAGKTVDTAATHCITDNLFATITNANFDGEILTNRIKGTIALNKTLAAGLTGLSAAATYDADVTDFAAKAKEVGVLATENEDVRSLRELLMYGLKGLAAYVHHANALGYEDAAIDAFTARGLASLLDNSLSGDDLTALVLEAGKFGVEGMALLDKANTESYGNPEITEVDLGVRTNPGILISGHDLRDLEMLLEQTQGTGVDVYTHGEMLPAHYYPKFKKYENFAGNYGNAWWKQKEEFEAFNGPIVLTTNCLVPPKDSYKARVFTTGVVGYPGCPIIPVKADGTKDFSEVIACAKASKAPTELETGKIVGGFAHEQVFALADKVIEAVKSGHQKIRRHGRLRRQDEEPQLLHRICQGAAKGYGHSHGGMCKVQVHQARSRRYRRHSARPRCRPVQRFLQPRPHRAEAEGSLWPCGRQRASHCL